MKRKFIDEVSVAEMLKMREAGMTNQDIANALDVSYQTIHRYLGVQPKSIKKRYGFYKQKKETQEEKHEACLSVTCRTIDLSGVFASYTIADNAIKIILDEGSEFSVNSEQLGDFIRELQAIQRNIDKLDKGREMW